MNIRFKEKPSIPASQRKAVIKDLQSLKKETILNHKDKILSVLKSNTSLVIIEALHVISRTQEKFFLPYVHELLKDDLPIIQVHALQTIFDLDREASKPLLQKYKTDESLALALTALILLYVAEKKYFLLQEIKTLLEEDYDYYFLSMLMLNTFDSYLNIEKDPDIIQLIEDQKNKADPDSDFYFEAQDLLEELK